MCRIIGTCIKIMGGSCTRPRQVTRPQVIPINRPNNNIQILPPNPLTNRVELPNRSIVNAVLAEGLALTVSDTLARGNCSQLVSTLNLLPESFFKLNDLGVVFIHVNPVSNSLDNFSCAILKAGAQLTIENTLQTLIYANRQRIYYSANATRNTPAGTAVHCGPNIIGLHEKPGCAISFHWIAYSLKCEIEKSGKISDRIDKFLALLKGEVEKIRYIRRIYGLCGDALVSLDPADDDFIEHVQVSHGAQMCTLGSAMLLCGGIENSQVTKKTLIFSYPNEELMARKDLHIARKQHCLTYLKGYVYCISGIGTSALKHCERYSVKDDEWNDIQPLPKERVDAGAVEFQETVYVIGGLNASNSPEAGILRFSDESWVVVEVALPIFRKPVLAASNDSVYICGSKLTSWRPADNDIAVIQNENFSKARSAMLRMSLFIFIGKSVVEVQINKIPTPVPIRHESKIP